MWLNSRVEEWGYVGCEFYSLYAQVNLQIHLFDASMLFHQQEKSLVYIYECIPFLHYAGNISPFLSPPRLEPGPCPNKEINSNGDMWIA